MMQTIPANLHLDNVANRLLGCLPWSPMDFIREICSEAERRMYVQQLTRSLSLQNDLRCIHELSDGRQVFISAERLPWDSAFFGYNIARLNGMFPLDKPNDALGYDLASVAEQLVDKVRAQGITYMLALIDTRDLATVRALCQAGFTLIETRCFYHRSLVGYHYQRRFPCRLANTDDIESLATTAQTMVNQFDRFHSDPWIRPEDADRMMRKWVSASICEGFADATIVPEVPEPTAFCTVKYHKDKWQQWGLNLSQPVFSAVSGDMRGWYLKILSEIHYHLIEVGATHSFLSTQITNRAVIRVWEKLGYSFGKSEYVFRKILS